MKASTSTTPCRILFVACASHCCCSSRCIARCVQFHVRACAGRWEQLHWHRRWGHRNHALSVFWRNTFLEDMYRRCLVHDVSTNVFFWYYIRGCFIFQIKNVVINIYNMQQSTPHVCCFEEFSDVLCKASRTSTLISPFLKTGPWICWGA